MASFKDLKARLQGKPLPKPSNSKTYSSTNPSIVSSNTTLELEEARYLLSLIAKSDFSGKDIQIITI